MSPLGVFAVMCEARAHLPEDMARRALGFESPQNTPPRLEDVERVLRCTLQEHGSADRHHALVLELEGIDSGTVWARWTDADQAELIRLPACPGEGARPCNEFAGHPGGHSFEVHDHLAAMQCGPYCPPL